MGSSRHPGPLGIELNWLTRPSRTPGPLGLNDQGDPNAETLFGDIPGPLGTGGDPRTHTSVDGKGPISEQASVVGGIRSEMGPDGVQRTNWLLRDSSDTFLVVKKEDVKPLEEYSIDPEPLIARMSRWMNNPHARKIVLELCEVATGNFARRMAATPGKHSEWLATTQLKDAFRQQVIVLLRYKRPGGGTDESAADGAKKKKRRSDEDATGPAGPPRSVTQLTWIEIQLLDELGVPMEKEPYRVKLPDGSIQEGLLDSQGRARFDQIEPGVALVSFPDLKPNTPHLGSGK